MSSVHRNCRSVSDATDKMTEVESCLYNESYIMALMFMVTFAVTVRVMVGLGLMLLYGAT